MNVSLELIKQGLVGFWSLWFTIVLVMNVFDALKEWGVLPESWKAASSNYAVISKHTGAYNAPEWLNRMLFLGVMAWQVLIVVLLWAAFVGSLAGQNLPLGQINTSFGSALLLFAAFLLADEILSIYDTAQQHLTIFIALLVSLIVLHLL